jgi:hypothetical protein
LNANHLAGYEPVEQHADCGEVLLDGRLLEAFAETANVGRDVYRLHIDQLGDILAPVAPGEETPAGVKIRRARVRVVDGDGEEFQKTAHCLVAAGRDDRGHDNPVVAPPYFTRRQRRGFDCHKLG